MDSKCALLAAPVRAALSATTIQARSGAVRDGWSDARLDGVSVRAAANGRGLTCTDPMVVSAAEGARAGYLGWAKMFSISLPGTATAWNARRLPDLNYWVLWQDAGPNRLGLKTDKDGKISLLFTTPLTAQGAPGSARMQFRDAARASKPFVGIPGVAAKGIAATAAPASIAKTILARSVTVERDPKTPALVAITFPEAALAEAAKLDPREAIEVVLTWRGQAPQRYYLEIGDLAVAQAFLAAKPL